ncbi:hypothetical protein [Sandarakinorhabdus sp.]|uniref:hypothetical protein n=1 Tax=Sandarakinorhabdus sp. TaxID=1916663 RepID=UPI003F71BA46
MQRWCFRLVRHGAIARGHAVESRGGLIRWRRLFAVMVIVTARYVGWRALA